MSSGVERNIHRYFVNKIHFVKKCDTKLLKRYNCKNSQILNKVPAYCRSLSTKIMELCACLVNFKAFFLKREPIVIVKQRAERDTFQTWPKSRIPSVVLDFAQGYF